MPRDSKPSMKSCFVCETVRTNGSHLMCTCGYVCYCSTQCQKDDWKASHGSFHKRWLKVGLGWSLPQPLPPLSDDRRALRDLDIWYSKRETFLLPSLLYIMYRFTAETEEETRRFEQVNPTAALFRQLGGDRQVALSYDRPKHRMVVLRMHRTESGVPERYYKLDSAFYIELTRTQRRALERQGINIDKAFDDLDPERKRRFKLPEPASRQMDHYNGFELMLLVEGEPNNTCSVMEALVKYHTTTLPVELPCYERDYRLYGDDALTAGWTAQWKNIIADRMEGRFNKPDDMAIMRSFMPRMAGSGAISMMW